MNESTNANAYISSFHRKSQNGFLYDADERCDGEYFDPAYTQIDRILEIGEAELATNVESESNDDTESKFGIILDKKHPEYKSGTGRQFLIKWGNLPYSESSYEFE